MSTKLNNKLAFETVAIPSLDQKAAEKAQQHQNVLTKPRGSLGRLEELSVNLAGLMGTSRPQIKHPAVIVAAGSHGVASEGISAFPSSVTAQMVENFLNGGAAINVLADCNGVKVLIVDAGIENSCFTDSRLHRVGNNGGTSNFIIKRAMTIAQANQTVESGYQYALQLSKEGVDAVALGDMGIGNTTSAAAIASLVLKESVEKMTGRGTGINPETHLKKIAVIKGGIEKHSPDITNGIDILSAVGGFEIAFLTGCAIGASSKRIPVIVDGFPTSAAALIATVIRPEVRLYLLPSHCSQEPGHISVLNHLGLSPLFDLQMRLGEGSGAVIALPILRAACACLSKMASFEEAGVDDS